MRSIILLMLGACWLAPLGETPVLSQTLYTEDGFPTGTEEEIRWRVNRGRFDSASENQARATSYTDVPASAGPLAPNQSLTLASRRHSEDMARLNVFQHATVPGSLYYNSATQPDPWDRMRAEGYLWNGAGENIAAGYANAEAVYVGWWKSAGHRKNMYSSSLREIGNGDASSGASAYGRYYTMDLGSRAGKYFFTDTLFRDLNQNGAFEQAEAIPGVSIFLQADGVVQSFMDRSSPVGSFAIPIESIRADANVQVVLSNSTAAIIWLDIPRSYNALTSLYLAPGQRRLFGTFKMPASQRNIGLRDVTPSLYVDPRAASLAIIPVPAGHLLRWTSQPGLSYRLQASADLQAWSNLASTNQLGTGGPLTFLDPVSSFTPHRFYRLLIR